MTERPPLVADEEWQDTGQIGATYAHTYYPAFIDIPSRSAFITPINGKPIYIHLVKQIKVLEVTDFGNYLYEQKDEKETLPIIKRQITGVRTDSVSANASDAWGGAGILFAQEPSLDGKLFRNAAFTEIVIGWEIRNQSDKNDISIFYQALRRLVYTYRYLTPDLRASLGPALKGYVQTIRRGSCIYKNPRAETAIDRLRDNEPQKWHLQILSTKGYDSGVAAHSAQFGTVEARAMNLGSYLMDGFVLPETVAALEAIAEEAFISGNYRSAVVEAMSLTELAILAAWRRFRSHITLTRDIDDPNGHDWRFLSEKLSPVILSLYNGNRAPLLKRLHRIVKVRHRVAHRGYRPVADEADDVLSTARTLIRILEIPSKYRANWILKPGMPEPVPSEA